MTGVEQGISSQTLKPEPETICADNEPSGSACTSIWRLSQHTSEVSVISGGLNGGSVSVSVDSMFLVGQMYLNTLLCNQIQGMVSMAELFSTGLLFGSTRGTLFACAGLINAVYNVISTCNKMTLLYQCYYEYILDDSVENEKAMVEAIKECYKYGILDILRDGVSGIGTWYALYW